MSQEPTSVTDDARVLGDRLDPLVSELAAAHKALKALSGDRVYQDPVKVRKLLDRLRGRALVDLGLDAAAQGLAARVLVLLKELEQERRLELGRSLKQEAEAEGLKASPVSLDPLVYRIAPLSVEIDLESNTATLLYARCPVGTCKAGAKEIVGERKKRLKVLERKGFSPEDFFRVLRRAYAFLLLESRLPEGSRVPIVDLLPIIALLVQDRRFHRNPDRASFKPYTRANLAFDLFRLRRAGHLSDERRRLALGTAAGGTTRDKKAVLWIEEAPGTGQYYHSLAFMRKEAR